MWFKPVTAPYLLTVIRHTRSEEEAGRRELLGSAVVGRQAGLAAALSLTIGANLIVALLVGLGMMSKNLPTGGSFALGLQYAAVGSVFAAIGAVAAQLTNRAGTARAIGLGILGLAFILRVAGDTTGFRWLSWLSPLGWAEQLRPFSSERWWVFIPIIGLIAVLSIMASFLLSHRDIGSGLIPTHPGPATASPWFHSPIALAWRLHRTLLIGWAAGLALMGVALGGIASSLSNLLQDTPQLQQIITKLGGQAGIVDAYFAGIMGLFALVVGGYSIQAASKMRTEEMNMRAEPVLATSVGRMRWLASHLFFSVLGPAIVLAAMGLAAGLIRGITAHDLARQLPRIFASAMVQLPAVWVLVGIAVALFGLFPKWMGLTWGALGLFICLLLFGAVLNLPQWVLDLSPFAHIPKIPGGSFSVGPFTILIIIAMVLIAIGSVSFKRRDFGKV